MIVIISIHKSATNDGYSGKFYSDITEKIFVIMGNGIGITISMV